MTPLYEDNHIIIVSKRSGEIVQGDKTGDVPLSDTVGAYLKEKYNKPGNVFVGVPHRLDRPVRGVMVFAKTSKCASRISEQIRNRTVKKKYRAIVYGAFEKDKGEIRSYLLKNSKTNLVDVFDTKEKAPKDAKECFLEYEVIGQGRIAGVPVSLLSVDLHTGRSHQIRAQLSHLGHPILYDVKYGAKKPAASKETATAQVLLIV